MHIICGSLAVLLAINAHFAMADRDGYEPDEARNGRPWGNRGQHDGVDLPEHRAKRQLKSSIGAGETLAQNFCLVSPSQTYQACLKRDGNFVVVSYLPPNFDQKTLWATNTANQGAAPWRLVAQSDGNLVIYDNTQVHLVPKNKVTWAANTKGSNIHLNMQDDGNLVLYDGSNRQLWASNTKQ